MEVDGYYSGYMYYKKQTSNNCSYVWITHGYMNK